MKQRHRGRFLARESWRTRWRRRPITLRITLGEFDAENLRLAFYGNAA